MATASRAKPARKPPARRAASARSPRKAAAAAARPSEALVPVLAVEDAAQAIAWYKRAFGARETDRRLTPEGKVVHAELAIGDARLSVVDVLPGAPADHPTSLGGTTVRLQLHLAKVDRAWARAVSEGAVVAVPLADQPWGERLGTLRDPLGHVWSLAEQAGPRRAPRGAAPAGQLPP
jgi:PhnB protein